MAYVVGADVITLYSVFEAHLLSFFNLQAVITDIPGTKTGTFLPALHDLLLKATVLKVLPRHWRMALDRWLLQLEAFVSEGLGAAASQASKAW